MDFTNLGFYPADILVPTNADMKKWSVVACDQYTSEPDYWQKRADEIGDAPSTMKLMLPEIYLDAENVDQRIVEINGEMDRCLTENVFTEYKDCFVFLQRTQSNGQVRSGLVGKIDLEDYSYIPGDGTYIRATEGTILSRIPPRVKVRQNAALEFPHIMLLVDDRDDILLGGVRDRKDSLKKLYDFDLCGGGGHSVGYLVDDCALAGIAESLKALTNVDEFEKKYNIADNRVLLFAAGDGNHSLATAKEHWQRLKKADPSLEGTNHPARYALVEVVNIHDKALEFEPIHRVVFDVNPESMLAAIKDENGQCDNAYEIEYIFKGKTGKVRFDSSKSGLPVGALQAFLDKYLEKIGGRIDYIHGDDVVGALCKDNNTIGFLLPPIEKASLFKGVILDGVLPRKTFSMGEAADKRFYLEGRRIR